MFIGISSYIYIYREKKNALKQGGVQMEIPDLIYAVHSFKL